MALSKVQVETLQRIRASARSVSHVFGRASFSLPSVCKTSPSSSSSREAAPSDYQKTGFSTHQNTPPLSHSKATPTHQNLVPHHQSALSPTHIDTPSGPSTHVNTDPSPRTFSIPRPDTRKLEERLVGLGLRPAHIAQLCAPFLRAATSLQSETLTKLNAVSIHHEKLPNCSQSLTSVYMALYNRKLAQWEDDIVATAKSRRSSPPPEVAEPPTQPSKRKSNSPSFNSVSRPLLSLSRFLIPG
jgi:hypothetical protein